MLRSVPATPALDTSTNLTSFMQLIGFNVLVEMITVENFGLLFAIAIVILGHPRNHNDPSVNNSDLFSLSVSNSMLAMSRILDFVWLLVSAFHPVR